MYYYNGIKLNTQVDFEKTEVLKTSTNRKSNGDLTPVSLLPRKKHSSTIRCMSMYSCIHHTYTIFVNSIYWSGATCMSKRLVCLAPSTYPSFHSLCKGTLFYIIVATMFRCSCKCFNFMNMFVAVRAFIMCGCGNWIGVRGRWQYQTSTTTTTDYGQAVAEGESFIGKFQIGTISLKVPFDFLYENGNTRNCSACEFNIEAA